MGERLGQYELEKRIGSGGMADVFLARGPRGICVIKRPHAHLCANADFVRMFLDEASLLAQLHHPGIAQIYDLGQVNGVYYLAMEYVPGFDLMTMSLEHERQGELIAVDLCARIIADAAAALHYAHEAIGSNGKPLNLIHRDITPHNILLSTDGQVKLIDFGVAKSATGTHRTEAGLVKGKYAYMAPEQITGQDIDRRVDIYALGLCLYELLTNTRAIPGNTEIEQIDNARASRMTPIERLRPNIPEPIRRIVASCVHPDRAGRYQTALEVKDQLDLYLSLERRTVDTDDLLRLFRVVAAEVSHLQPAIDPTPLNSEEQMGRPTEREQQIVGAVISPDDVDEVTAQLLGGARTSPSNKVLQSPYGPPTQLETSNAAAGPGPQPLQVNPLPMPPPSGPTRLIVKQGDATIPHPSKKRSMLPFFLIGVVVMLAAGLTYVVTRPVEKPVEPVALAVIDSGITEEFDAGALAAIVALPEVVDAADAGEFPVEPEADAGEPAAVQAAVINVASTPETVVFVDGKKWGPVPQEVQVEGGKHTVLLTNGTLNIRWQQVLTVKAGEARSVNVKLAQGKVHFTVNPFGVAKLNGKEIFAGLSESTKEFYEGTYVFEISNAELKAVKKVTVVVKPGETAEASVSLR